MKITKEWLEYKSACVRGKEWFNNQAETDSILVVKKLMQKNHYDWANWTLTRLMNHDQQIKYAIFAAELVIKIYEDKYPGNDEPRKAIEAAKEYLKDKTEDKRKAAAAAAVAANAAADAAYVAADDDAAAAAYAANAAADAAAANAAADAAYVAADDDAAAAYAVNAVADAAYAAAAVYAYAAAASAAAAADAAADAVTIKTKIIDYGIELLEEVK